MGYATIVSGGTDGRYTISMDFGEATRTTVLAALSLLVASLETKVSQAQSLVDDAKAKEDAQAAKYDAAVDAFIAQHASPIPGSPKPDDSAVRFELKRLRDLQAANSPLRVQLLALKFQLAQAYKMVSYWNGIVTTNTRDAWCTDFTENAAPGQVVATMDIPGDDNLIVLAPGCRAWTSSDGQLVARELMSPAQCFFNAAIFPGWQIDKPTYRWGTVTAVDAENSKVSVSLAPATSSAQRLDINRETALNGVPADYMETGSAVFVEGDRVVVGFLGQDWANPYVMGFLDNPRPAGNWEAMSYADNFNGGSLHLRVRSGATTPFSTYMAAAVAGTLGVTYRIDRGGWITSDREVVSGTHILYYPPGLPSSSDPESTVQLAFIPGVISGAQMVFSLLNTGSLAAGQIIEIRVILSSVIVFNAAMTFAPTTTAPVALIGRLLNLGPLPGVPDVLPMRRLAYTLFQTSGT